MVRLIAGQHDKRNWKEFIDVITKAEEKGYCIQPVENCLLYAAFTTESHRDRVIDSLHNQWKEPRHFTFGCLDNHIDGRIPSILPLPNFEIPVKSKLKLLLKEINFCTFLDMDSFHTILKKERMLALEGSTLRYGITARLLYGCLSLRTVLYYLQMVSNFADELRA